MNSNAKPLKPITASDVMSTLEQWREDRDPAELNDFPQLDIESLVEQTQQYSVAGDVPVQLQGATVPSVQKPSSSTAVPQLRTQVTLPPKKSRKGNQGKGKEVPQPVVREASVGSVVASETAELIANKELVTQIKALRSDLASMNKALNSLIETVVKNDAALATLYQRQEIEVAALRRSVDSLGNRAVALESEATSFSDVGPVSVVASPELVPVTPLALVTPAASVVAQVQPAPSTRTTTYSAPTFDDDDKYY